MHIVWFIGRYSNWELLLPLLWLIFLLNMKHSIFPFNLFFLFERFAEKAVASKELLFNGSIYHAHLHVFVKFGSTYFLTCRSHIETWLVPITKQIQFVCYLNKKLNMICFNDSLNNVSSIFKTQNITEIYNKYSFKLIAYCELVYF